MDLNKKISKVGSAIVTVTVMALSTFFTGLSMKPNNNTDKWLKALLMIHGVFYFS